MSDERCEKTDLLVDQCGHCVVKARMTPWEALYDGTCGVCNQPFSKGTRVIWTSDGIGVQHTWH